MLDGVFGTRIPVRQGICILDLIIAQIQTDGRGILAEVYDFNNQLIPLHACVAEDVGLSGKGFGHRLSCNHVIGTILGKEFEQMVGMNSKTFSIFKSDQIQAPAPIILMAEKGRVGSHFHHIAVIFAAHEEDGV